MVDREERPLEVSVVMPCLNEAETLAVCIRKALQFFAAHGIAGEVIIADNGSSDGSQEIAREGGARLVSVQRKGYGSALMGGIAEARGTYVVMGDADDSYNFSEILPFIEKLREGYDLVMGCRFPRGGGRLMPGAMPWKHQWIGNPVLTAIGRLFFGAPVADFHCGLRAFRREAYDRMDLHTTGMEFASEMVVKSSLKGMRIAQVPVTLYKDGRSRPPHLRSWRDGWRHLRFMLLYSPRWLFLVPGILLFLCGGLLGGTLLLKGIQIGGVILGTNSLLVSAMAVLVGFQLILFALFTKIFAITEGLLPEDPRLLKLNRYVNLEVGVLVGVLVALAGFGLILAAFLYWQAHGYGPISYPESLRLTIPGITAFTLGIEIVFSSFFLSILGMRRR